MSSSEHTAVPARDVATTFFALARTAVQGVDVVELFLRISQRAVDVLPVDACGILMRDNGGALRAVGSSSAAAELLDLLQIQDAEGPCLECVATGVAIDVDVTEATARWPRFAAQLAAEGFTAVHAAPIVTGGRALGALNLFGTRPLDADEAVVAQAFADLAALMLLQRDLLEDAVGVARRLQEAVQGRATLSQAIGIVAERFGIAPDDALRRLQAAADAARAPIVGVAGSLVARDGSHPPALDLAADLAAEKD